MTLHPEMCSCPRKKNCVHVLAAKMSIGIEKGRKTETKCNLSALSRNNRGRKGPIETNQMSIEAAPDSMESMIAVSGEKEVSKISANFEQSSVKSCSSEAKFVASTPAKDREFSKNEKMMSNVDDKIEIHIYIHTF